MNIFLIRVIKIYLFLQKKIFKLVYRLILTLFLFIKIIKKIGLMYNFLNSILFLKYIYVIG